jgi:hypothetical protein
MAILLILFFLYFDNALLPRYLILVMPVLAILSARYLYTITTSEHYWLKMSGWIVIILVLAYSFLYTIQGVVSRYPDSRTQAVSFIRQNIPAGSEIGIAYSSEEFGWKNHIWRYPKIDSKRYKIKNFLDKSEYVIISDYDSRPIKDTLLRNILEDDMTLPEAYSREWYGNSPPSPKIFTFFKELYSEDS